MWEISVGWHFLVRWGRAEIENIKNYAENYRYEFLYMSNLRILAKWFLMSSLGQWKLWYNSRYFTFHNTLNCLSSILLSNSTIFDIFLIRQILTFVEFNKFWHSSNSRIFYFCRIRNILTLIEFKKFWLLSNSKYFDFGLFDKFSYFSNLEKF